MKNEQFDLCVCIDSRYRLSNDLVIVVVRNMDKLTGFSYNGGIVDGFTHVLIRADFMFQRTNLAHEVAKIFGIHIGKTWWSNEYSGKYIVV